MTIFWILCAGLIGLALFFVALPLLRPQTTKDSPEQDELNLEVFKERLKELDADLASGFLEQSQYVSARRDLERDLLRDVDGDSAAAARSGSSGGRWLALVLAVAVPATAVYLYLQIGEREMIQRMEAVAFGGDTPQTLIGPDGQELPPLEVLVQRLAERLNDDPGNIDGWLMLGRTYFTMRQPAQALEAISRAYLLAPERPEVALAYAEALAANSNNSLEGEPAKLIEQVLEREPDNTSGRWLLGMLYYQRGQFTAAATAWQRILDEMEPGSEEAEDMRGMIAEARSQAGTTPPDLTPSDSGAATDPQESTPTRVAAESAEPTPSESLPAQAETIQTNEGADTIINPDLEGNRSLTARVTIDEAILERTAPDDVVFVFARAAAGPPMPLAVQRIQVKDLPASVTLDDSMAMMPAMSLSAFPQVVIGARISKSGLATPQPGDLEGEVGPIDGSQTDQVAVTIDRVRD
jgi:cytochrome c-type biogenesis protein CcmH